MTKKSVDRAEQWSFYFLAGFAFFSNLSIAVGNVFLGLTLVALCWHLCLKQDDWKDFFKLDKGVVLVIGVLIGSTFLSAVFSGNPAESLQVFADYYIYRLLGLFAVLITVRDRRRLFILLKLVAISFMINVFYILWQGGIRNVSRTGGFVFYMSAAAFLAIGVPVSLLLWLQLKRKGEKYLAAFCGICSTGAALYNGTRGAWIAILLTSLATIFLVVGRKRAAIAYCFVISVFIGMSVIFSPILQERVETLGQLNYQSNSERILLWQSAYHMFEDHPLLGVGFGQFKKAYQTQYVLPEAKEPWLGHAHNNFMQLLAECGALGGVAFLSMWGYFVYFSIIGWRREKKIIYIFLFTVVMATMLHGLTEYNMGNSMVTKLYWFLLGISLQLINIDKGMVTEK